MIPPISDGPLLTLPGDSAAYPCMPLSCWLQQAGEDLRKCAADPRYKISMGCWHVYETIGADSGLCHVCLGGAVLAQTFCLATTATIQRASAATAPCWPLLLALDALRTGCVKEAFQYAVRSPLVKHQDRLAGWLQTALPNERVRRPSTNYNTDAEGFFRDLQATYLYLRHLKV